jgi:hypothetical protein
MISIGDVDILKSLIELEQRVGTLEKAIEGLNNKNAKLVGFQALTQEEYNNYKILAGEALIKKYPNLGLKFDGA